MVSKWLGAIDLTSDISKVKTQKMEAFPIDCSDVQIIKKPVLKQSGLPRKDLRKEYFKQRRDIVVAFEN